MAAIVFAALAVGLSLLLLALLRSLDWEDIRSRSRGVLSMRGVWGVVAGGAVVGVAYGAFAGIESGQGVATWLARAVVDGLVVACAGAFYLGFHQRRERMRQGP